MELKFKYEKGITLISLVVTIIVIIILTGVSINLTLGENGIIKKAKQASQMYNNAQKDEQELLNNIYIEAFEDENKKIMGSGIWRINKNTEKNSLGIQIYVNSIYYSKILTLNEYKEQYFVKTYNDQMNKSGRAGIFNSVDEIVLYPLDGVCTSIEEVASSRDMTREEFLAKMVDENCSPDEYDKYIDMWLGEIGYTNEDILKIEEEYEEYKSSNQTIIEIPEEIEKAKYLIIYPDGTTEEILGSNLNSFRGMYYVRNNKDYTIKVARIDNANKLEFILSNLGLEETSSEDEIWKIKKNVDENSGNTEICLYSKYYDQTAQYSLNRFKEQYIIKKINELNQQEGYNVTFNSIDEMILGDSGYTSIEEALETESIDMTREEFIVEYFKLNCDAQEYANVMLKKLGYTEEDILKIEEEYKSNQTVTEIPEEIKTATYLITYPNGTTEEVLGSNMDIFKKTYNIQDEENDKITITRVDKVNYLETTVNNIYETYIDDSYTYKFDVITNGYAVKVNETHNSNYGKIKNDINGVPITSLNDLYANCTLIKNIDLSYLDTSKVKDMEGMFRNCIGLTNINLSSFDTSNVTDMGSMFDMCSSLTTLDLSNFDTSNVTNMNWMFNHCSSLTILDLSNFDTSNVTNMNWMFNYCSSLTTIYVGQNWTDENADTTDMFSSCGTSIVTNKR